MTIATKFELRKLTLPNGVCPFDEWFKALERDDQYMVENRLLRLRLGSFGEVNTVGDAVWELKFRKGRALRIYYGQIGKEIVLLISGGDKRTQKKDIKRAKELFANYKSGELKNAKH